MAQSLYAKALKNARNNAQSIRAELEAFGNSSKVFSSNSPRLIEKYENKWVAVYNGNVAAAAGSFEGVSERVEKLGLPLRDTMIRRVERKTKNFIL